MKSPEPVRLADGAAGVAEVERVLRLRAEAPAPEGLEERIKATLLAAPQRGKVLAWRGAPVSVWTGSLHAMLRGAAAAAIVLVVAGGSWSIFSRVQPARPAIPGLPRMVAPAGFSSAGAIRTPQTLEAPQVHAVAPVQTVQQTDSSDAGLSSANRAQAPQAKHKSANRAHPRPQ